MVINLQGQSLAQLADRLGPAFKLDSQMAFETITATSRHVIDIAGIPFKVELFHLSDDPHDQERFRRRVEVEVAGRPTFLPTREDVIITKVRWASLGKRTKDWDDARDVIAVQGDRIDWNYVHAWCDRHGTREVLDEIRVSIPPM